MKAFFTQVPRYEGGGKTTEAVFCLKGLFMAGCVHTSSIYGYLVCLLAVVKCLSAARPLNPTEVMSGRVPPFPQNLA